MYVAETWIQCPFCGETLSIEVEPTIASQKYIEDCQVCCSPIALTIRVDPERGEVTEVRAERS